MKKNNNYEAAAKGIKVGGIITRIFAYLVFYVPVTIILAAIIDLKLPMGMNSDNITVFIQFYGYFILMLTPYILWELSVQLWRKKQGFSLWKNIEEEIKQKAVDDRISREKIAYEKNRLSQAGDVVDKTDIGYWHELLQKGAITEDEYAAKKKELL